MFDCLRSLKCSPSLTTSGLCVSLLGPWACLRRAPASGSGTPTTGRPTTTRTVQVTPIYLLCHHLYSREDTGLSVGSVALTPAGLRSRVPRVNNRYYRSPYFGDPSVVRNPHDVTNLERTLRGTAGDPRLGGPERP